MQKNLWFKMPTSAWEMVAEALPKPWPRELVEADLQYWANEARRSGGRPVPGARTLGERWGWTRWKARQILLELDPEDRAQLAASTPRRPVAAQSPHSRRPVDDGQTRTIDEEQPSSRPVAAQKPASRDPILEEKKEIYKTRVRRDAPKPSSSDDDDSFDSVVSRNDARAREVFEDLVAYLHGQGVLPRSSYTYANYEKTLKATLKVLARAEPKSIPATRKLMCVAKLWAEGPNDFYRTNRRNSSFLASLLRAPKPGAAGQRWDEYLDWEAGGFRKPQTDEEVEAEAEEAYRRRRDVTTRLPYKGSLDKLPASNYPGPRPEVTKAAMVRIGWLDCRDDDFTRRKFIKAYVDAARRIQ